MFCKNCGKEMLEGTSICLECGFGRERDSMFGEPEDKEFHFVGVRGNARGTGLREIYTDVKMEGMGNVMAGCERHRLSSAAYLECI